MWIQSVVFPILGMGMGAFFLYGTYVTVNKWLDRRHERELAANGGVPRQQLQSLAARLQETESRVEELEERLDFAERLLAQRRERDRLPGSGI